MRVAAIIGATGATGYELSHRLAELEAYARIQLFVRVAPSKTHPKHEVHEVDF